MTVAIRDEKNHRAAIESLFADLGFSPGKRVFVKPNLCGRAPVLPGENTSVEVMDALLDVLLARGCEVTIGHGELLGSFDQRTSFSETLKASGFIKYVGMPGVRVLNLDKMLRPPVKCEEMTFHLPLDFLQREVDTYINLAKIKTHMETTLSLSLKNQMGLPSQADRVAMHKTDLERCIARLATLCRPHLSILEGYPAMEGNGPHHGTARDLGLIAAGDDMLELDSCMAALLGFDAGKVRHFVHAADLGAGKFAGNETIAAQERFRIPDFLPASMVHRFGRSVAAYPTYACSRCISAVELAGRAIKKYPLKHGRFILRAFFGTRQTAIIFGRADRVALPDQSSGGRLVCVGSCSKAYAEQHGVDCLDKCPPGLEEAREFIVKRSDS